MQRKRGFTLIELLVVIAIIAILAAILFPVFAKAREKAKQSKSLNNIRQLALAVQQYSNDYNELLPGWGATNTTGAAVTPFHNTWDEQIDPQVKSKDVYNNGDTGIQSPSQPNPHTRVLTYGLNGLLITANNGTGNGNWAGGPSISSPSSVSNPAGTILFAELATTSAVSGYNAPAAVPTASTGTGTASSGYSSAIREWIDIDPKAWVEQNNTNAYNPNYTTPYGGTNNAGVARDLYSGGGSYSFLDGHVKFLRLDYTINQGNNIALPNASAWVPGNAAAQYNMWLVQ